MHRCWLGWCLNIVTFWPVHISVSFIITCWVGIVFKVGGTLICDNNIYKIFYICKSIVILYIRNGQVIGWEVGRGGW